MITTINNKHNKLNVPNKREQNQTCLDSAEREGLRPKGNVPNLRFPEFQGEWEKCKLGNIANITGGYAFKSDTLNSIGGKYQVVKMGNLYQNQLDLHRSPSYTNILTSKAENVILRKGDIAITLTGTNNKRDFGYTYIFNDEKNLLLNQRCGLIRTKGDPYFLSCLLKTYAFLNQFFESATGGTGNQANVSTKAMEMFSVNTPSLKEQKKIGELMALLDERIATQNKIIDKLQSLIKGIRNDVFGKLRKNIGFNAVVGDVLDYEQPQSYIVENTEYANEGTPVLTANKAFVLGYTLETDGIYDKGDCIIFDDFTLDCKYVDFPFKVKSSAIKILTAKNKELLRYTFEFLKYLDLSTEEHKRHYIAETQNQEFILPTEQIVKTIAYIFSTLSLRMETAVKRRDVFDKQKQYLLRQMFI